MPLSPGTPAPDFTLKTMTADGLKDVTLSSVRGSKNVVLLFFPAAFTGVCTQELCDVSSGFSAYADLDAEVYGISPDTPFAQDAWAKQNGITVTLLSDYQKEVAKAYDVLLPDLIGLGPGSARAAFVIDKQGVIRYAEQTPSPLELPNFEAVRQTLASL
ncbi:MAG: redoxin domain-containing protein [Fimbriimonadales bacterium]|nr:redoxin domain-containing protein [Fimbriimonadales bacterium]